MRFFLDENFPKAAHALLVRRGHEIVDIRGTADEGAEDGQLFEMAQRCEALFLKRHSHNQQRTHRRGRRGRRGNNQENLPLRSSASSAVRKFSRNISAPREEATE
jgi:hypothetical protein